MSASPGRRHVRALALLALLTGPGCALDRMAADAMVPVLERTKGDFERVTVARYAREAAPGLLATLDGVALSSPDNPALRLLQAEMHATFAFAFLEREDPTWAVLHYRKGRAAALAALAQEDDALAADLERAPAAGLEARLAADAADDALPALFWWAFARGAEVNLRRGEPAQVADLPRVDAVMSWVLARAPGFFHGGPHLYFAMRNLALPPSFGGKPEKGVEHLDAVDRLTGGRHLMAKVLRAELHAPLLAAAPAGASVEQVLAAQQAAWDAFYGPLVAVARAGDDVWPEQGLPNAVARERAKALLRDPEAHNIIPPPGAVNEYAAPPVGDGWGDDGGQGWDDGGGGEGGQ